ncbi:MAG TPA: HAD-IC family P-type ATPase, partial [Spirochaetota bacterium]
AENQDPIDLAIITKSGEKHYDSEINEFKLIQFKPFDPINKRAESECEDRRGNHFKSAKGAPQIILSLIENKERFQTAFNETINIYASRGLRTLAVGKTDTDGKWKLVGLIALQDPPRDDSAETIQTAKDMGIQVKMVTGDHTAIAKEIAKLVHLGTNILPAESIINQSDNISRSLTENADGFAQVFPEHKYHIVELLQQNGHIVGMTGDGVNDAPALKKADAGIAVSGSTDAAKSAAAIVLTKPGLSVIIDAIKQSRIIFQRMNNYAIYRIAETIRVIFFITLSILAFNFYPITALMIVLLAVLNDAPIMSIAFDNVKYSRTPDRWNMRNVLGIATYLGLIGVVFSFLILFIGKELFHFNDAVLQSFIYLKLSIGGHLTVFVARTKGHFWSIKPAWPLFLSVIITQLIATLITVYGFLLPAMGWLPALFVWGYALAAFLITDFLKVGIYNILDHVGIRFKR